MISVPQVSGSERVVETEFTTEAQRTQRETNSKETNSKQFWVKTSKFARKNIVCADGSENDDIFVKVKGETVFHSSSHFKPSSAV